MKSLIIVASMLASTMVFAQGEGAAAGAAQAPAASATKETKKTAKMECLKENPKLKGKDLKHCVDSKIK